MNTKEKAKQLADLYNELAEKEAYFLVKDKKGNWNKASVCPSLQSDLSRWKVADNEKIINMEVCKKSGIDCQFRVSAGSEWSKWTSSLNDSDVLLFNYKSARVRQDFWFYNVWTGKCPIPNGLIVEFKLYIGTNCHYVDYADGFFYWPNVKAFKVVGVLDGWSYD